MKEISISNLIASHKLIYDKRCRVIFPPDMFFRACTTISVNTWHVIFGQLNRPHWGKYLSKYLTNLMYKICFTISFISCLYVFRAYVLIIRGQNCRLVHETATYKYDDTRGCVMQFWPPDDEHICSKYVEAWNKTYCETNFVHQFG